MSGDHDRGQFAGSEIRSGRDAFTAGRDITVTNYFGATASPLPGEAGEALAGRVRAGEADPRRLGVHAAISVAGVADEVPPEYVPRDADDGDSGVRARVAAAARRGGFILLVGGSSAGKTRCAAEAVKMVLPEWWLVHPDSPGQVAALAQDPPARTVVWLDELQRYFDGEHGLTGGVIRALLNAPHPVVIIGTLWPERYSAYSAIPAAGGDRHALEREVLSLADVVRIDPEFSPAEQDRARAAAERDPRLQAALDATGYGLTQTLAAAPQLVARWQDARTASPYARAVLTAALDAARLGTRDPVSIDFLRAAAPGYCTSQQQAEAPEDWLEQALAYATEKLHGAAAALSPAGTAMGQVTGYIPADYLVQHASGERRNTRVPASTWDAILAHTRSPADAAQLAYSAHSRLLYRCAIPLYRLAGNTDNEDLSAGLAELLEDRGDLDGLRALAATGEDVSWHLGRLLSVRLAGMLAERGDLDDARQIQRALADVGNRGMADQVAQLLARLGDAARPASRWRLPRRRHGPRRGELDELRAVARTDLQAHSVLVRLAAGHGAVDDLRAHADAGDEVCAEVLAELLAESGDEDALRARTDAGDREAAQHLARLLAGRGEVDELRARADAGDLAAASQLAGLLAERGDLEEAVQVLSARTDAGDEKAPGELRGLLFKAGDVGRLRALADAGDEYAAMGLARLLADRGDLDELRALADASGDENISWHLARLLAARGDLDELRTWADAGDQSAAQHLATQLAEAGDEDELRARADAGNFWASRALARLLAQADDVDGLRALVGIGEVTISREIARLLHELLTKQGQSEEAERVRWFGLNPDGSVARA